MDKKSAKIRINELRAILLENSKKYYVDNAPELTDFEFDALMRELDDLEKAFPEYLTPDSPTQKVGSDLSINPQTQKDKRFQQLPHKYPMLSLGNTYNIEEVEEFAGRVTKTIENPFTFCCELKFDGTAICLNYRNGVLYKALTRGDGVVGDDVTENVRQIKNIPTQLKGKGWPKDFEIRGEILMPYESFERLNAQRIADEEVPFANPRNAASGSLKLLDPKEVAKRDLSCTLYHIPGENFDFLTHDKALSAAQSWGLPVSDERRICSNISEIEAFIDYWDVNRKYLPFATDGIVIKVNELDYQAILGYTAKSPKWAVAYKFKAEQALTELLSIDYQVGRTGAVTPVANLNPVQLSGTVVRRATLNNADQMALLDIRVGDWVYVEKGGEIIPKITSVELSKRKLTSVKPVFPQFCPDCGTELIKIDGEAKHFCPNSDGCPTQIKGKLLHFISRKAMNVLAGEVTIEQLYKLGLVRTPADFYDLHKSDLLSLEGWKERSAQRFLDSLRSTTAVGFEKVLFALGIRYVGERTAKELAQHFKNIDSLIAADIESLYQVQDIGEVIAGSVFEYFREEKHIEQINRLKKAGLNFSLEGKELASSALDGLTIVISGNFSRSRDEMKELIEANGGKNSGSISGKTAFLLAGEKPGPEKIKKANELGLRIVSEEEFLKMIPEPEQTTYLSAEEDEPNLFSEL